jgi:hypothetical protein
MRKNCTQFEINYSNNGTKGFCLDECALCIPAGTDSGRASLKSQRSVEHLGEARLGKVSLLNFGTIFL